MVGPEVDLNPTPNSRAIICANVVFPKPGGPESKTWSIASTRPLAASIKTDRLSHTFFCPTNSPKL